MVKSVQTSGWLVTNVWDKITGAEEAYAVTATKQAMGPVARSVFIIEKAKEDGAKDNCVRYGQDIRLTTTGGCLDKPLYLQSIPLSPLVYARFSR